MRKSIRFAAGLAVAGLSLAATSAASAANAANAANAASTVIAFDGASSSGSRTATTTAVRPCSVNNVSFYFGGYSYGLGQRSFDLTLLAHDGITCSLSDTPLIALSGPPSQKKKIPVQINGRGGTLILRPDSPLHATFFYSVPDTQPDTLQVSTLTLAMPDKTSQVTDFLFPGVTDIYSGGVSITSWTTGIGLGQGEERN